MKGCTLALLAFSAGAAALRAGSTPMGTRPEASRTTLVSDAAFAPLVLRGGASSDASLSPWVVWWRVLCRIMFPGNPPRPRAPPAEAPPAPPAPAAPPRAAARSGRAAGARQKRSGGAAGGGGVVSVHSKAEFDKVLASATQKQLVVVDFFATWCGPCQQIAPKYAAMASELTHVRFVKVGQDPLLHHRIDSPAPTLTVSPCPRPLNQSARACRPGGRRPVQGSAVAVWSDSHADVQDAEERQGGGQYAGRRRRGAARKGRGARRQARPLGKRRRGAVALRQRPPESGIGARSVEALETTIK